MKRTTKATYRRPNFLDTRGLDCDAIVSMIKYLAACLAAMTPAGRTNGGQDSARQLLARRNPDRITDRTEALDLYYRICECVAWEAFDRWASTPAGSAQIDQEYAAMRRRADVAEAAAKAVGAGRSIALLQVATEELERLDALTSELAATGDSDNAVLAAQAADYVFTGLRRMSK